MQLSSGTELGISRKNAQRADIFAARGFFSPLQPVLVARAPGRLDVMGGNVDYTGGAVLQGLLREAIWVATQSRIDDMVRVFNPGAARFGWNTRFGCTLADLRDEHAIRDICDGMPNFFWGRYVLGAIYYLRRTFRSEHTKPGNIAEHGVDLFIHSELPPNKGVSSSAALTIAALKATAAAWKISLEGVALATAGQWVENVVAGAACGIMDQAAIVLGKRGHLLPLLCQPCLPSPPIALPAGIRIWGIDSMTPRSTSSAAYETARAAAFMGYRMIADRERLDLTLDSNSDIPRWRDSRWNGYLSNLAPSEFRARYERMLPESMLGHEFLALYEEHVDPFTTIDAGREYPVRAAVRYATEEHLRVQTVSALLETAGWRGSESYLRLVGESFCQSHYAYTECGLGSEACDEIVKRAHRAGLPGAKMTGGGAGGVVAVLARAEDHDKVRTIAFEYARARGTEPTIFEGSSDGVDVCGVRMIRPQYQPE